MKINDYILKKIKPLTLQNTVADAKNVCKNLPISHLIIVEENKLLGCFFEGDIQILDNEKEQLSNVFQMLQHFYADEKASVLELLKQFANNDCNTIAVLSKERVYLGYYELSDVLDVFANSPFLYHQNETLIVEKNTKDFSMSEISQIVETNNGKLKGMYISSESNDKSAITLQISSNEINEIIQTFRRYNYRVITTHEDDFYLEDLKNRSEYLQKYLNI